MKSKARLKVFSIILLAVYLCCLVISPVTYAEGTIPSEPSPSEVIEDMGIGEDTDTEGTEAGSLNAPIITGVEDGATYTVPVIPNWEEPEGVVSEAILLKMAMSLFFT